MSVVSGVISRQVLPACGSLCFFCPAMRARSRQPVKRYKKLISDIFPRSQEEEPNDRRIGKLCEYAAKNPLRIPKIADSLEQRCYKELRIENFRAVKIVMCIYRKLLVSCREQLPLFANSLLTIIHTLMDQTQDEMLTIGCESLFDFVNNQNDGTYMFNLDGFIPKLCQMAQEVGEDERAQSLRAAGLQALSAMVWFMGENSHISVEFDNIVSVVLENYGDPSKDSSEENQNRWVQEVQKTEGHVSPSDVILNVPSWKMILNEKGQLNVSTEEAKNPCFWSRVCLHNMAKLGKEVTTMRRVLESLFRYFDNGNLWPSKHDMAFPVLKDMQILMDDSGQNTHFLLSILVKHLDHKNVLKQPDMQLDIVQVITSLARLTKAQSSVAIVSAVSDVMRHLRKSIHLTLDDANLGEDMIKWNRKFHEAVDECLTELSSKVGDAGVILDVMSTMLENISSITVICRTTMSAIYRTAQIIASLPNLTYKKRAFPEALFHQLLPAMLHPDHETRIGAHQIFSVVLVPTSISPQLDSAVPDGKKNIHFPRTLSRTVSVFSSSAALFEKLKKHRNASRENLNDIISEKVSGNVEQKHNASGVFEKIKSTYSRVYSSRNSPVPDSDSPTKSSKDADGMPLRLSSHQITLLLSSIYAQCMSPANMPENYEAIAHTYSLVLLFSRAKNSYVDCLICSFQLAFTLRNVSLKEGGTLPPSRRRSLFLLSTCMIIFSSKAYNILPLVSHVKATLTDKAVCQVDPYFCLVEDSKLQLSDAALGEKSTPYGSKDDDSSAQRCLSGISISEDQNVESLVSIIIKNMDNLPAADVSRTRDQLLKEFVPDDLCSIGGQFADTSTNGTQDNFRCLEKAVSLFGVDDNNLPDTGGNTVKQNQQLTFEFPILSVDQLLQSVLETAHHVGRMSVSTAPDVTYKEMARNCETLLVGKQQKMSYLISTTHQGQGSVLTIAPQTSQEENKEIVPQDNYVHRSGNPFVDPFTPEVPNRPITGALCATEYQHNPNNFMLPSSSPFMLPASSPYDNFLKAAGC